jgi:PPP family 3-phenylpropionic acid transporter
VHAGTTASYQLLGVLVRDEGLSATVTGGGMAFGVLAEVLALFAFPALERRFELATLLCVAFGATALRWLLVARSLGASQLVALQGFHGLTFGLYWAASVRMLERIVPSRLRATGQTLFSAATFAIGGAVGYRAAGFAYDRLGGARPVFERAALVELVPLLLAMVLGWRAKGPRR